MEFERQRGAIIPWIPAMVGVGIMIGLLVAIIAWKPDRAAPPVTAPPPASPADLPPPPVESQGVGTAPASPTPASKRPTPPKQEPVIGRYTVDSSFGDSFIAQVKVTNTGAESRNWTVRLVFGDNVGELRASWVDGQPQPRLRREGQTYTFTSTVPIGPRASLALKVNFSRTGRNNDPLSCTTNGVSCRKG